MWPHSAVQMPLKFWTKRKSITRTTWNWQKYAHS